MPNTNQNNAAIRVNTHSLIALASAARSIPLSNMRIRALQSGQYISPFKGRGMEFDEVRPYQPGDDIRSMDWKVTARTGKAHTKLYREERERPVLLWLDLRQNMFFATRGAFKAVVAARAAALLAWSACAHGDRVGGFIFSEDNHHELRPQRGKSAVLHFIKVLNEYQAWEQHANAEQQASLQHSIARLRRVARPGSLVFLISDFRKMDEQTESHLSQLARHCDIVLIHISDPIEHQLPPAGRYRMSDGHAELELNTFNKTLRDDYQARYANHEAYLKNLCLRYGMYFLPCSTQDDITKVLQKGLGKKR